MNESPITCRKLTKRFGNVIALESVTLDVSDPCVIGLVGPNGSGKSTLLKLLMGAVKPSDGEVSLFGRPPRESRLRHTDIGYLGASDRMFPELTVLENMIYRGRFYNMDKKESSAMAARLLRERGLYNLRDRKPDALSTGQRRQVSLLSTLMHEPRILLLDEPTTGIDIMAISQIYQLMKELCEKNCTILLATHSLEELCTLCSRTIALHDGQLVFDDRTAALGDTRDEVRDSLHRLFLSGMFIRDQRQPQPPVRNTPENPLSLEQSATQDTAIPDLEGRFATRRPHAQSSNANGRQS